MADHNSTIAIRLPRRVVEIIDQRRGQGLFPKTRSEWIRDAIAAYSMKLEPQRAPARTSTENDDMTDTTTVTRDDQPDLVFSGELIASSSSHHHEGPQNTRWSELRLWRTEGGSFIAGKCHRTRWIGEKDSFSAQICDDEATVVEAFGHSDLAKSIYADADINATETVA